MLDKEMLEQFQILLNGMEQMEERLTQKIKDVEEKLTWEIDKVAGDLMKVVIRTDKIEFDLYKAEKRLAEKIDKIDNDLLRVEIKLENEVVDKIKALHDGYKLAYEKQKELERRVDKLGRAI